MPILIIILLAILIAQIGFWDALGAILGGVLMILLLIALIGAIIVLALRHYYWKLRARI